MLGKQRGIVANVLSVKECLLSYFVMQDVGSASMRRQRDAVLRPMMHSRTRLRHWPALVRRMTGQSSMAEQRVILATAYCSDAELIVLDEPTGI